MPLLRRYRDASYVVVTKFALTVGPAKTHLLSYWVWIEIQHVRRQLQFWIGSDHSAAIDPA